MKDIFINLFWPAAAGNVAWAFFNTAIYESSIVDTLPRLLVILLLAFYLAINWARIRIESHDTFKYWLADTLHLSSIIVFSIATERNEPWVIWALASVFAITIIAHTFGMWDAPTTIKDTRKERFWLIGVNLLGLIVLFTGYSHLSQWSLPVALAAMLTAWMAVRWGILKRKHMDIH